MKRIVSKTTASKEELDKFWNRKFNITQYLFDKQLAFVEDPAPFKIAVCSRRSGKTVSCAAHLVHTAINNPDTISVYITMTGTSGKRIIWKEFKSLVNRFNLPVKINDLDLSLTFPNRATIYVIGAKDETEIEKIRGIGIKLCYIDECQSFKEYIEYLIDDIIGPALMDNMGSLCLIGTPSAVPVGYFHKCWTQSEGWAKHSWTFWDNFKWPAVLQGHNHKEIFEREMKRSGRVLTDPSVRREFFGEWATDIDSLLIRYNKDKNDFNSLPAHKKFTYIMGIDVGHDDADAIAILAYSDDDPTTYLVEERIAPKQDITDLMNQIKELDKMYKVSKMVMDTGGLGKKIAEELIRRHQLPIEYADKTRKMENIALLNDALRIGMLRAKKDSRFAQDSFLVEIDKNKTKPDRIVVSSRFHSDIIDAVLYAFKLSPAYAWEPPQLKAPKWGTKEWAESQHNEMFEKELEGALKEQEYSKWLKNEYD